MLDTQLSAVGAQCLACQRALRPGARFCPGCGHTLTQSAAPPERPVSSAAPSHFAAHWSELKRIGWLFGLLLGGSFVTALSSSGATQLRNEVILSAVDAGVVLAFFALRPGGVLPLLRLPAVDLRGALALLGVAVGFVFAMSAYFGLLDMLGVPMTRFSDRYLAAGWPLWGAFAIVSITPALVEELAFRGVIQSGLERVFQAREAWLIQAALFSVLHLMPIVFPSHFAMGLCFGWMRLRSRSLYPGMLLHAAWNALVLSTELS